MLSNRHWRVHFRLFEISPNPASITFFLSIYDFSYDMTSMLSSDERDAMRQGVIHQREAWMNEVAEPYLKDDVEFNVKSCLAPSSI